MKARSSPAMRVLRGLALILVVCASAAVMGLVPKPVPRPPLQHRPADPANPLAERFWQDRAPRDTWDPIRGYIFTDQEGEQGHLGVRIELAGFHAETEVFAYRLEGSRLHLLFPQTGERRTVSFQVKQHQEGEFDLALELDADPRKGGTPQRYLSRASG